MVELTRLATAPQETGIEARQRLVREALETLRAAEARCAQADRELEDARGANRARRRERDAAPSAGDVAELRRLDRLLEDGGRADEIAAVRQKQAATALEGAHVAHRQAEEALRASLRRVEQLRDALPDLERELGRVNRELENAEWIQGQRRARLQELRERREIVRRELGELTGERAPAEVRT